MKELEVAATIRNMLENVSFRAVASKKVRLPVRSLGKGFCFIRRDWGVFFVRMCYGSDRLSD